MTESINSREPRPIRDGLDRLVRGLVTERYTVHHPADPSDTLEAQAERREVLAEAVRWYDAHHRGQR